MHPEMALVLLTVFAGAGQGIFILLFILDAIFSLQGIIPQGFILTSGIISLALQAIGVIASTTHLGNPHRGWRAMLMVKNSWLSREVITLSMSAGCTALYILMYWKGMDSSLKFAMGMLGVLGSIGFYISSSMVYASVRFVKEWSTTLTPINFTVFGITSGIACGLAVLANSDVNPDIILGVSEILLALTGISLLLKLLTYRYNARSYLSVSEKNAIGVNNPSIKLMDMGTSYAHYNTTEYYHPYTDEQNKSMQVTVLFLTFVIPATIAAIITSNFAPAISGILSIILAVSMLIGMLFERRLFFIQGNNIQNLYYGNFRHSAAGNPIVSAARKGTPVSVK